MVYLITLLPIGVLVAVYFFFLRGKNFDDKILKVLGVVLFIAYASTLYKIYAIDNTVALHYGIFSPVLTVLLHVLRWITACVIAVGILSPFYKSKNFKNILSYIAPVVLLLNFVFLDTVLVTYFGEGVDLFSQFQLYSWAIIFIALTCISLLNVSEVVKNKEKIWENKKSIGTMFILLVLLMPAYMPQSTLSMFFGDYGAATVDFNGIHRITIYFDIIIMIAIYIKCRNKTKMEKDLLFAVLTMSGLFQFFYLPRSNLLTGLPLHLCNTAIIMMFFAFIFKMRGVFYFTYFVNVLGALCATLFPNVTSDAFSLDSVHFWYNHIYAFVLPILGVALKVYPRPDYKMMKGAIITFTAYYILVAFINAWFNNYVSVDYFFIYGNFMVSKFEFARSIKDNYTLVFVNNDLHFIFFWLYQLIFYLAYILLMQITWVVYDYLYKVSDAHRALQEKLRKDKMDVLNLRKELNGRPLTDPIDPEGTHMIKIENFTKVYGNAKKAAVEDFSLTINDGEVFGFLGHNGAGKSTTIKSLVGIQSITSGRMLVSGYDVAKQPLEAKRRIGYVSDNHAVYEKLTGREYINYIADLYLVSKKDRDERIEKYVNMFKLQDAIDNEIKSYSHGMKQKIVVISSLIHDPDIWVLDEPLTGLDPISSHQIKDCMRDHANRGHIVFFSSHVIEVVEKICDKICIIDHGKLQGVYSIAELKEKGIELEQLYLDRVVKNGGNI